MFFNVVSRVYFFYTFLINVKYTVFESLYILGDHRFGLRNSKISPLPATENLVLPLYLMCAHAGDPHTP
jgi:hypothetical protein